MRCRTVLAALAILFAASPRAHAESVKFVGLFRALDHDGAISTTPTGVVVGLTGRTGTGVEVLASSDGTYKWLMVDFFQVTPAPTRGKSFQPFGAFGPAIVSVHGEQKVGFNIGAGLIVFLSDHFGVSIDYRYFRAPGTIGGIEPSSRVISWGVDWRF